MLGLLTPANPAGIAQPLLCANVRIATARSAALFHALLESEPLRPSFNLWVKSLSWSPPWDEDLDRNSFDLLPRLSALENLDFLDFGVALNTRVQLCLYSMLSSIAMARQRPPIARLTGVSIYPAGLNTFFVALGSISSTLRHLDVSYHCKAEIVLAAHPWLHVGTLPVLSSLELFVNGFGNNSEFLSCFNSTVCPALTRLVWHPDTINEPRWFESAASLLPQLIELGCDMGALPDDLAAHAPRLEVLLVLAGGDSTWPHYFPHPPPPSHPLVHTLIFDQVDCAQLLEVDEDEGVNFRSGWEGLASKELFPSLARVTVILQSEGGLVFSWSVSSLLDRSGSGHLMGFQPRKARDRV